MMTDGRNFISKNNYFHIGFSFLTQAIIETNRMISETIGNRINDKPRGLILYTRWIKQ